MRAKTRLLTALLVVVLSVAAASVNLYAASSDIGFSVEPNIPSNQRGTVSTYFDLQMQPGQDQEISVTINNEMDQDIVVEVEAVPASTNRNGIITYADADAQPHESAQYRFSDLVSIQDDAITIPQGASYDVRILLTMPDEEFDGVVLGALRATRQLTEEEQNSGNMILNQYGYVVAVQMRMNDRTFASDFAMGDIGIELVNYRAAVVANVANTQPVMVRNVTVSAELYESGGSEPIYEVVRTDVEFAPNAFFPLTLLDEGGYGYDAGDYRMTLRVNHEGNSWEFEEEFTIDLEAAAAVNDSAVNQNTQTRRGGSGGIPVIAIAAIGAGVVIILIIVVLVMRSNKRTKALEEQLVQSMDFDNDNNNNNSDHSAQ